MGSPIPIPQHQRHCPVLADLLYVTLVYHNGSCTPRQFVRLGVVRTLTSGLSKQPGSWLVMCSGLNTSLQYRHRTCTRGRRLRRLRQSQETHGRKPRTFWWGHFKCNSRRVLGRCVFKPKLSRAMSHLWWNDRRLPLFRKASNLLYHRHALLLFHTDFLHTAEVVRDRSTERRARTFGTSDFSSRIIPCACSSFVFTQRRCRARSVAAWLRSSVSTSAITQASVLVEISDETHALCVYRLTSVASSSSKP